MSTPTLIVATPEQLAELIRKAVGRVLVEQREDVAPALLDRSGIGRTLGISPSTVDRLRREGLPCVLIGDSPRFLAAECVSWLLENRRPQQPEVEA